MMFVNAYAMEMMKAIKKVTVDGIIFLIPISQWYQSKLGHHHIITK